MMPEFDGSRPTDSQLVSLAKQGSATAFEELYGRHRKLAFSVAFRILKCKEDAEDVLQETLFRAFKNLSGFDERATTSTWLTRIAINSALMELRKRKRRVAVSLSESCMDGRMVITDIPSNTRDPEQQVAQIEALALLRAAVNRLPRNLRDSLALCNANDLSVAEISEVAGVSTAAAKSRLFRARHIVELRFAARGQGRGTERSPGLSRD